MPTVKPFRLVWNRGNPPRRGVYRCRSDGPSPNEGFRYWDGERWHGLAAKRAWAGPSCRRSALKYPILWQSRVPAETPDHLGLELTGLQKRVAELLAENQVLREFHRSCVNLIATLGHPEATADDENRAEASYQAALQAANALPPAK